MKTSNLYSSLFSLGLSISLVLFSSSCKGQKETEINKYGKFLSEIHQRGQFNGNVLVVENGKIAFQGAYGQSNTDPADSLNLHSVFRLGSVSKQFTAMAVMILKEEGKLKYDQDLSDFIPELPYKNISIRHLLNHTSGLPDYTRLMAENWKPELEEDDPERFITGNEDIIKMLAEKKPEIYFRPGEQWQYSNTGYVLLASVVSRASGLPFEQFLKEYIFKPIGMNSTVVYDYVPGKDPSMPLRVYGYRKELNGELVPNDCHFLNPAQGDGGIYSTLGDMYKWDQALYTDKLVPQSTLQEAFTPGKLNDGSNTNYGFGWFIPNTASGKKVVDHTGGWVGFVTYIYRETEENNCIVILTNNSSSYFGGAMFPLRNIMNGKPYTTPKLQISEAIGQSVLNEGIDKAKEEYRRLKSEFPDDYIFRENQLDRLGNQLLQMNKPEEAIEILRLNVEEYPGSARALNGYGDGLISVGDTLTALQKYKKALTIDSGLTGLKEKIDTIEEHFSGKEK